MSTFSKPEYSGHENKNPDGQLQLGHRPPGPLLSEPADELYN